MENLSIVLFFGVCIFLLGIVIIKQIVNEFRSHKFILVEANIIDKVKEYTEEWGKYFPETWSKASKFYNTMDKINNITNHIPKNLMGNSNRRVNEQDYNNEREISYVFICEYEVDGKKYYYSKTCDENESLKKNLNNKVKIKYNPQNPEFTVTPKTWWKTSLIALVFQIILGVVVYILVKQ